MTADELYVLRATLEQLADELVVPDFVVESNSDYADAIDGVRQRLGKLADEVFEHYLEALRGIERRASAPHGLAKCGEGAKNGASPKG